MFYMKIIIFTAVKYCSILNGRVTVMLALEAPRQSVSELNFLVEKITFGTMS